MLCQYILFFHNVVKIDDAKTSKLVYTVDIPEDNGVNYLSWYDIINDKQYDMFLNGVSEIYQKHKRLTRLNSVVLSIKTDSAWKNKDFGFLYNSLAKHFRDDKAVSLLLIQCGFDGIKYPTGTRWQKPEGAKEDGWNYVIFDANKVKITEKNRLDENIENEYGGYHGTHADFDKFNHKKYLSTGAGSQSFGWGTYITDDKTIADSYATNGSEENLEVDGKTIRYAQDLVPFIKDYVLSQGYGVNVTDETTPYTFASKIMSSIINLGGIAAARKSVQYQYDAFEQSRQTKLKMFNGVLPETFRNYYEENGVFFNCLINCFDILIKKGLKKMERNSLVYEVDIPDDNGSNYIEWYEDLPNEFMKRILIGLHNLKRKYLDVMANNDYTFRSYLYSYLIHPNFEKLVDILSKEDNYSSFNGGGMNAQNAKCMEGGSIYRRLQKLFKGSDKATSLFLMQCGFDGIKYPTGTRWQKPEGASDDGHNFVLFDANKVKILKKGRI